jgi:peptide/nickel transport system ATP-binding protein
LSALLSVRNLVTTFRTDRGLVRAVDGVSFDVARGSTLGIVGESGCGKTVTALSILRLVQTPPGNIASGEVMYGGQNLLALDERDMRAIRGRKISMIFQEPMTSLNPVYTAGHQIAEVIRLHQKASASEAKKRTIEMLRVVGIASPEARFDAFPHEMSAGMRQRVMIAMALACEPELLIADEPTTALDVTIQAQILDLLRRLQETMKMSIVFITHDLGVVAEFAQQIAVMYAGKVVEEGTVKEVLVRPRHPYTEGLLRSVAALSNGRPKGADDRQARLARLPTIPGSVPDLTDLPPGCRFAARCSYVESKCKETEPALAEVDADIIPRADLWRSRCFFAGKVGTS